MTIYKLKTMNIRKYLLEQSDSQKIAVLEKAIESGCISKYTDFEMDPPPQPVRVKISDNPVTEWAITGKSRKTGDQILFLSEFMGKKQIKINLTEAQKDEKERNNEKVMSYWVCEQSKNDNTTASTTTPTTGPSSEDLEDQKEYLKRLESIGWTTKRPPVMDLDNEVYLGFNLKSGKKHGEKDIDPKDTSYDDVKGYAKYFSNNVKPVYVYKINTEKKGYDEVDRGDCRQTIDKLYDLYEKAEGDNLFIRELVRKAQSCINQKNFTINPFLKRKIDTLTNLNVNDRRFGKYKLQKLQNESLSKRIKKTLLETKEKKNNLIIERKLVESRIRIIVENLEKFKSLSNLKKIKVGFKFLQEMNYLKTTGLLKEELGSILKQIYGKSMDAVIQDIMNPFLNSIVNKLGLSNELQIEIIDSLKSKNQQLIDNMNSCQELSKFLSNHMVENILNSMKEGEIFGSQIIDRTVLDSMKEDSFKMKLGSEIEKLVCETFDKFTENAKNLVTKLTLS